MQKIVIHDLGDWERDERDTRWSMRVGGSIKTYAQVSDIANEYDRTQVEWMLDHGELVTQCGNVVYQIRS